MSRSSDEAVAHVLEALTVGLIVFGAVVVAVHTTSPNTGAREAQQAYEDKESQVHDTITVGKELCCPKDPSATNLLEDRAMHAWAGHPDLLHDTVDPLLAEPRTTDFAVKASWAPPAGNALHTIDLYRTATRQGKSAGDQQLAEPSDRGPMYVVPRLDKVSANASADILAVPVDNVWPYTRGLRGAHEDAIQTTVQYPRPFETRDTNLTGYTEVTGSARPAIELSFREPDWQELEAETPVVGIGGDDIERFYTQVLTSEDLASEKTIHNELNDVELEDGEYPHHPFKVQVNITDPPAHDTGTTHVPDHQENRTLTDAYQLTIHVPRNWTDIEINTSDENDNKNNRWIETEVQALDSGGHRITSLLDRTVHANLTGHPPDPTYRWTLLNTTEITAPFRFHARPPNNDTMTELGFHDIQAHLEPVRQNNHETATLTVEVANSPGRVHRSLSTMTPTTVPKTPWANDEHTLPEGVELPLGAVFKNGGEATTLEEIRWRIPQHPWPSPDDETKTLRPNVTVLEDYTGKNGKKWSFEETSDELVVTWDPTADLLDTDVDPTCDQLQACAVAATIALDGRAINPEPPWAPPRLVSFYNQTSIDGYVDWHVRTHRAWDGAPSDHRKPAFALAHRHQVSHAGPAENAYRFTLPPTLTPACEDEIQDRNEPRDAERRNGRMHYDLGPREDGIPHLAEDCDRTERPFAAIAKMGDRWTTQAIGNHPYTSTANLSKAVVSEWQSGLAESDITGPESIPAGETRTFKVKMGSLLNKLAHEDVGNVTLVAQLYDPYNAWENTPWHAWIARENTGIDEDSGINVEDAPNWFISDHDDEEGGDTYGGPTHDEPCRGERTPKQEECKDPDKNDPIPPRFNLDVLIPSNTVPGTHLLVLELRWEYTALDGTDLTETGRLIEPFDVTYNGHRVQDVALGMTAWDTDWR